MNLAIAYTRGDGGITVLTPNIHPGETEAQAAARVLATDVPLDASDAVVIDKARMPQNRRWRDAWRVADGKIVVDLDEAKKIRVAELEREQSVLIEANAKKYMIAVAKGDTAIAQAAQQKAQALSSLDKTAIEASVAVVADLVSLDKHEPDAIKDAKQGPKK